MPVSKHRRSRGQALSRRARSAGTIADNKPKKKKTNKLYLGASVLIAVLVIAGFAVGGLAGGRGAASTPTGSQQGYVEGIGVQETFQGNIHLPEGTEIQYASFPPSSGDHWPPQVIQRCGFYEEGLPDEVVVHHLEHGNIVVNYNLPDPAQVQQLRGVMDSIGISNIWGITRSYGKIPQGQVAVTAWGVLDTMDGVDGERITRFFEAYAGNLGPESVPCR